MGLVLADVGLGLGFHIEGFRGGEDVFDDDGAALFDGGKEGGVGGGGGEVAEVDLGDDFVAFSPDNSDFLLSLPDQPIPGIL